MEGRDYVGLRVKLEFRGGKGVREVFMERFILLVCGCVVYCGIGIRGFFL